MEQITQERLRGAVRVEKAWNEPGINPSFHRMMQEKLRRDWPVLAKALDALEVGP